MKDPEEEAKMRKHVKGNVSWIGYLDWELETFHGDEYSIGNGSSQNAYLIEEEKTVLMDTVWMPHREWFIENLKSEIDLNKIDYIIMQHGEQDHSGALPDLMKEIPGTPIYCTEEGVKSLEGQYGKNGWDLRPIHTGDTLDIGNGKKLIFMEMKMLHWPDSMATYMTGDNILFSMDAFGQHFAVEELFNDLADQGVLYREAMKYFANILNPFAMFVNPKLEEIAALDLPIDIICPSHGVIWRDNPMQIVETYAKWADAYKEDQVTIVYDTMWDGTKKLAHEIGNEISRQSPSTKVKIYNAAKYDKNDIMTEVFRSKAIAVGSPTCANDVLSSVAGWLTFLKSLKFKNKKAAAFGCYGWSGESVEIIEKELKEAGFSLVGERIRCNWNPGDTDYANIPKLVEELLAEGGTESSSAATKEKVAPGESRTFVCSVCGWVYDEKAGCPSKGIEPGTKWEDVPDDFVCPTCRVPKDKFQQKSGPEGAAEPETKESSQPQPDTEAHKVEEITGNAPGGRVFKCSVCGWSYSEEEGAPDNGIRPGTLWEDVPEDFRCPVCHVPKSKFEEE